MRVAIEEAARVYVSAVSAWEVAIKVASGRLHLTKLFEQAVSDSGFDPLPVTFAHTARFRELPRLQGDPFDRMLIAQALSEQLILVTVDRHIPRYDVSVLGSKQE